MEPYQQAPSQILRAIRACVTQDGEWTRDLPWMSQPALTASDRGISNRLTGRKVAKASRLWVGHKKNGCHQPIFCVRCDKDVFRTRPVPRQTKGVNKLYLVWKHMEIWIKSGLAAIVQERGSVCCVMTYSFMEGSLKSI